MLRRGNVQRISGKATRWKVAKKQKLAVSIEARSQSEVAEYLSSIDVLLLGPHYAVDLDKFQDLAKPYGVAVAVIPQDVYGALDGARILELLGTGKTKVRAKTAS